MFCIRTSDNKASLQIARRQRVQGGEGGTFKTKMEELFFWTKTSQACCKLKGKSWKQPLKSPAVAQSKNSLHTGQYGNNYWVDMHPDSQAHT